MSPSPFCWLEYKSLDQKFEINNLRKRVDLRQLNHHLLVRFHLTELHVNTTTWTLLTYLAVRVFSLWFSVINLRK